MLDRYRHELIAIRECIERPSTRSKAATGPQQRVVPLTEQINTLMRSLPPAQRDRPWSVAELAARLNGRFKARPSHGDVGVALRALGWTRTRDWSHDGGGRRVWCPKA